MGGRILLPCEFWSLILSLGIKYLLIIYEEKKFYECVRYIFRNIDNDQLSMAWRWWLFTSYSALGFTIGVCLQSQEPVMRKAIILVSSDVFEDYFRWVCREANIIASINPWWAELSDRFGIVLNSANDNYRWISSNSR